jgi:hypothetical protein
MLHTHTKLALLITLSGISLQTFSDTPEIPLHEQIRKTPAKQYKFVLVLHGAPRAEIPALAQAIANNSERTFVSMTAIDILEPAYIKGLVLATRHFQQPLVIYHDFETSSKHIEERVQNMLCEYLDEYANDGHVCFVFGVKYGIERMSNELHDRVSDRIIYVNTPDDQEREELLQRFSKETAGKDLSQYCSSDCVKTLIEGTKQFSGGDIKNLSSAANNQALNSREPISQKHLFSALNEAKARIQSDIEQQKEAYMKNFK